MTPGRRLRIRMKVLAWVFGAVAVLVTFIADDVDPEPQVTADNAPISAADP